MSQNQNFPNCFNMSLIDVGAAGGIHPRWGSLDNPNISVLMIEPEAKAFDKLDKSDARRIKISPVALSSEKGYQTLHVARKGMCSSFHKRNFDFVNKFPDKQRFEIISEEQIPTETLDFTVGAQKLPSIDFIKVDVEGHENYMIEAGGETLKQAIGIEAEMLFAPLFIGGAEFCDQHKSYTAMGYELFDVQRYYWKRENGKDLPSRGQLIYCNGLYLKSPEKIMAEENVDARRVKAAIRIYTSFSLLDLVQEMFDLAQSKSFLTSDEITLVGSYLKEHRIAKGPDDQLGFSHRVLMKISRVLHSAALAIEPSWQTKSWYKSDDELGQ